MTSPIILKFLSTTNDYDLLQDTNIQSALVSKYGFYGSHIPTDGINASITVFIDSITQIKINNENFYQDFVSDIVWSNSGNSIFHSIKIKDASVYGTISISLA